MEGKQTLRNKLVNAVGFSESDRSILVFTRWAAPVSKKALEFLPDTLEDITIKYRQGVAIPVGHEPPTPFGTPPYTVRVTQGSERYACGSSISCGNVRDAGTMTCLVRKASGELFGLSNNHVSGSCSHAGVGLPILAPGVADVAPNSVVPFTIGFHEAALTLVTGTPDNVSVTDNIDAAIFRIAEDARVTSFQGSAYDTPSATGQLVPGLTVEKVGRTTGLTSGTVISQMHGPFRVGFQAQAHGFSGSVYFDPMFAIVGSGQAFSDNGDSGSLITAIVGGSRVAVGIVVAGMSDGGAPGGKVTLALPIEPILNLFQVTLVAGHNI